MANLMFNLERLAVLLTQIPLPHSILDTPLGMQMINIPAIFIRDYRLRDNWTIF